MRVYVSKIRRGGKGEDSSGPNVFVSFCRTPQAGSRGSAFVQHTSPQGIEENSLAPAAAPIIVQDEHLGTDLDALGIAGAEILIDPDSHRVNSFVPAQSGDASGCGVGTKVPNVV